MGQLIWCAIYAEIMINCEQLLGDLAASGLSELYEKRERERKSTRVQFVKQQAGLKQTNRQTDSLHADRFLAPIPPVVQHVILILTRDHWPGSTRMPLLLDSNLFSFANF